ncbi:hypothetical protein CBL_14317 [Carabus blaptoides fortunei]
MSVEDYASWNEFGGSLAYLAGSWRYTGSTNSKENLMITKQRNSSPIVEILGGICEGVFTASQPTCLWCTVDTGILVKCCQKYLFFLFVTSVWHRDYLAINNLGFIYLSERSVRVTRPPQVEGARHSDQLTNS